MLPILLLFASAPTVLALSIALRTTGRKRTAAWIDFALLAAPLLLGGGGAAVLSAYGLAWRSSVKGLCVLIYCMGLLVLFLWAYIYLFRQVGGAKSIQGFLFSVLLLGVFVFVGFWYTFAGAVWMGRDTDVERAGVRMVADCGFMCDVDYYAYHGPIVRGREVLDRIT